MGFGDWALGGWGCGIVFCLFESELCYGLLKGSRNAVSYSVMEPQQSSLTPNPNTQNPIPKTPLNISAHCSELISPVKSFPTICERSHTGFNLVAVIYLMRSQIRSCVSSSISEPRATERWNMYSLRWVLP